jgi:NADPH2:quinone reductase
MSHAIVVHQTGGPDVLSFEAREPDDPGPDQVRIQVAAAGLNFIDVYFRTGLYPRPVPFVAGLEGAGTVDAVGADVKRVSAGDRVAWCSVPGSYAELANVPAERLVAVPDGVELDVAAAAMLQGMTAQYLVHATRETRPGDRTLVHAAAGGVGLLLVQMLKKAGAYVIGTCSSAEKEKLVREVGADEVIRYDQTDFAEETQRLSGGRGLDVVYDSVGRSTFDGSLSVLRPRGLLALFGQSSGPVPPFELQRLNNEGSLFITRPSLAHYTQDRAELEERAGFVFDAIRAGELSVRIGARFALSEAAEAHRALEGRRTTGKVLLLP